MHSGYHSLSSITMGTVWEGPVLRADIKPFDSEVWDEYRKKNTGEYVGGLPPCRTWDSGIYALDTKEYAMETAQIYRAEVVGQVDLWGRVVVFDRGYRAELCMIKKLWLKALPTNVVWDKKIIEGLEQVYDCDVEVL